MLQIAAAVVLVLHGAIHLIGFVVPWRLAMLDGFPYRTTVLGGSLAVGEAGVRLVGVVWLLLAVGFMVAGIGVWRGAGWAVVLAGALAVASIVVCVLGLPETVAGIVVNAAIIVVVAVTLLRSGAAGQIGVGA